MFKSRPVDRLNVKLVNESSKTLVVAIAEYGPLNVADGVDLIYKQYSFDALVQRNRTKGKLKAIDLYLRDSSLPLCA